MREQREVLELQDSQTSASVVSSSLPYGDREQNRKGNTKGLYRGILKTGLLHREFCVQSLWKVLNYRDKGKNKRCLHRDAKTGRCLGVCMCV